MPVGGGVRDGPVPATVGELISLLDHKNLNADLDEFREAIPTVENLATFAWRRLAGKFDPARLHSVTVWESDRTYCTCCG